MPEYHNIPLGTLVGTDEGMRLFVVHHSRDCDDTPLYNLCHDRTRTYYDGGGHFDRSWSNGWGESSLKIVQQNKESGLKSDNTTKAKISALVRGWDAALPNMKMVQAEYMAEEMRKL